MEADRERREVIEAQPWHINTTGAFISNKTGLPLACNVTGITQNYPRKYIISFTDSKGKFWPVVALEAHRFIPDQPD